jgi:biotin synthase-related radical SAM superfamily protein
MQMVNDELSEGRSGAWREPTRRMFKDAQRRSSSDATAHEPSAGVVISQFSAVQSDLNVTLDIPHEAVDASTVADLAVTDAQYDQLLQEQARIAAKMVMVGIDASESRKLKMLRWAIGRVEAARYGAELSKLEALAELHEKLARDVTRLTAAFKK